MLPKFMLAPTDSASSVDTLVSGAPWKLHTIWPSKGSRGYDDPQGEFMVGCRGC